MQLAQSPLHTCQKWDFVAIFSWKQSTFSQYTVEVSLSFDYDNITTSIGLSTHIFKTFGPFLGGKNGQQITKHNFCHFLWSGMRKWIKYKSWQIEFTKFYLLSTFSHWITKNCENDVFSFVLLFLAPKNGPKVFNFFVDNPFEVVILS